MKDRYRITSEHPLFFQLFAHIVINQMKFWSYNTDTHGHTHTMIRKWQSQIAYQPTNGTKGGNLEW